VQAAAVGPAVRRLEAQAAKLRELEERIAKLERRSRGGKTGRP
jgi:hypothetical protein